MEHQVCEKGIAVDDGKKIAIMVYPGLELLTKPCEQAYWGIRKGVCNRLRTCLLQSEIAGLLARFETQEGLALLLIELSNRLGRRGGAMRKLEWRPTILVGAREAMSCEIRAPQSPPCNPY